MCRGLRVLMRRGGVVNRRAPMITDRFTVFAHVPRSHLALGASVDVAQVHLQQPRQPQFQPAAVLARSEQCLPELSTDTHQNHGSSRSSSSRRSSPHALHLEKKVEVFAAEGLRNQQQQQQQMQQEQKQQEQQEQQQQEQQEQQQQEQQPTCFTSLEKS